MSKNYRKNKRKIENARSNYTKHVEDKTTTCIPWKICLKELYTNRFINLIY